MDGEDEFLTQVTANLLSENVTFDRSWITKISKQMAQLETGLAAAISRIDSSGLHLGESVRQDFHTMATRGWTIQMSLTPGIWAGLANQTPEETDQFFVTFYTEDNFAALHEVRQELTGRTSLAQWKALLEECFESLEAGRHLITVPALLLIIEGVVASAGQALTEQRVRLVRICAENAKKSTPSFMKAEMWNSMELFLEKLFQPAPFDDAKPAFINRHWILHGRDSTSWTVADALRLFNALQTVDSLLE
jgi:hypothetical protein